MCLDPDPEKWTQILVRDVPLDRLIKGNSNRTIRNPPSAKPGAKNSMKGVSMSAPAP
jgi:hypothetical protein